MGVSHIPAYACYFSHCCCASLSRAWLPLLCTMPSGSCNSSEVSLSPSLRKAEPAHCPPPALARPVLLFQPLWGLSTLLIPVCQSFSSVVSPYLGRAHQDLSHQSCASGNDPLDGAARWCGGCFAEWVSSCLLTMLCPTRIPGPFLQGCSQLVGPSLSYSAGLCTSQQPSLALAFVQ